MRCTPWQQGISTLSSRGRPAFHRLVDILEHGHTDRLDAEICVTIFHSGEHIEINLGLRSTGTCQESFEGLRHQPTRSRITFRVWPCAGSLEKIFPYSQLVRAELLYGMSNGKASTQRGAYGSATASHFIWTRHCLHAIAITMQVIISIGHRTRPTSSDDSLADRRAVQVSGRQ